MVETENNRQSQLSAKLLDDNGFQVSREQLM